MNDTIVAISTSLGVGAISIIRVSGDNAIEAVNDVFKGTNLNTVNTHTINYGHIVDKDEIIDEVLVSIMRSPRTFTKEDIVEINCHGGISTTNKVLSLLLEKGLRLAEPGEFTKRAYLNGRIDLIEAEGIIDLINAKTEKMRKLAINQVQGRVSNLIRDLRVKIRDILINIDVNIDYPEYEDILVITNEMINSSLDEISKEAQKILKESVNSKIIKEGINTIIIGRPNVGKSSILNYLLNEEKAIVTNIPGTTRDIVEGSINLDGIVLNVVDTAGIRETNDIIEQIGVNKSIKLVDDADLIIMVINNNEELNEEDIKLINKIKNNKHIIFINKSDLESKIDKNILKDKEIIYGNTISNDGLDNLILKIKQMFNIDEIEKSDFTYLSNARQISLIKKTVDIIQDIDNSLKNNVPIDIIAIDLKTIWELLGELIGERETDELIDELFKQFCLGK